MKASQKTKRRLTLLVAAIALQICFSFAAFAAKKNAEDLDAAARKRVVARQCGMLFSDDRSAEGNTRFRVFTNDEDQFPALAQMQEFRATTLKLFVLLRINSLGRIESEEFSSVVDSAAFQDLANRFSVSLSDTTLGVAGKFFIKDLSLETKEKIISIDEQISGGSTESSAGSARAGESTPHSFNQKVEERTIIHAFARNKRDAVNSLAYIGCFSLETIRRSNRTNRSGPEKVRVNARWSSEVGEIDEAVFSVSLREQP